MSKHQLVDRHGNLINLGQVLGKGGEGTVYVLKENQNIVANIYSKPPDQEKTEKIMAMAEGGNANLFKLSAWPLESIHTRSGSLVGFLMHKLQGYRPLFELYSPKLRLQKFSQADWRFLIHAATNVARAFSIVHEAGHVVGDVNHGNLLVATNATVKFIDTDSFQISRNGKHWLCDVGVATHQPPEMQGRTTYKGILRTNNQDNFGLAVLIFQLLCLARHPFSGRFLGQGDMPIERAITEFRFAYSRENQFTQMAPPPASLSMKALTGNILTLFERAFSREATENNRRPTPKEWIPALTELAVSLKSCSANRSHHYLSSLSACPWCDIEMKSNAIIFPITVQYGNVELGFESLWQNLIKVNDPGPAPQLPSITSLSVQPSPEARAIGDKLRKIKNRFLLMTVIGSALTLIAIANFGANPWHCIWVIGFGFWWYIYQDKQDNELTEQISQQFVSIKKQWDELSSNWASWTNNSTFTRAKQELNGLRPKYDALQQERKDRIKKLWDNRRQQQLHAHLDRYRIDKAGIAGVGTGRCATLQSNGIETAADVNHTLYGINGFGPKLVARLVDWRIKCECAFVFDSAKGVSHTELQIVERDIIAKRQQLERELSTGITQLTRLSSQIAERRKQLCSQASSLLHIYAQAAANAREVGIIK